MLQRMKVQSRYNKVRKFMKCFSLKSFLKKIVRGENSQALRTRDPVEDADMVNFVNFLSMFKGHSFPKTVSSFCSQCRTIKHKSFHQIEKVKAN